MEEGYSSTDDLLRKTYGDYLGATRGVTQKALDLSTTNYNELINMISADRAGSMAGWENRLQMLAGGYDQRTNAAMGMLDQLSGQERKDLRTQYAELGGQQQAQLTASGLGGTTVSPTMAAGTARQESDAMNRLNDMLTRERLGTYSQLSGEALAAKTGLTADTLGMGDYWATLARSAASEKGFNAADLITSGMGEVADIGFQQGAAQTDLASQYYSNRANLQMSYPQMWGNFMTANPVEFMDFSPLSDLSGQLMSYSQMLQQQRAADKAQSGGLFGGNAALGGAAGLGLYSLPTILSRGALAPTLSGAMMWSGIGAGLA